MRFQVDQAPFASALQAVSRAVSGRTTLPVLTGILLETYEQTLRLSGTDLEIGIRVAIPVQDAEDGSVVLPARYLTEFVRRIPSGTLHLEVEPASHRATLRWERSQYVIHGFSSDQFPRLDEGNLEKEWVFPEGVMRELIQQTSFAVSLDETRPALTGVHVAVAGGELVATATDGFRVAIRRISRPSGAEPLDVILPGRALHEIHRFLSAEGDRQLRLACSDQQALFQAGDLEVITRLIEGRYPNVNDLLPSEYPVRVRTDRVSLWEAAERAALLSDRRLTARLIVLEMQPDRIAVTSKDPEVGQAYEEVDATLEGEPLRIGVNARYLGEGLRQIQDDEVILELIDPVKAIRISGVKDESYQYIVFPVRL